MSDYQLTTGDRYIVDKVNAKLVTPEQIARGRQIHTESLEHLRPEIERLQRDVAMREYALAQLEGK